MTTITTGTTGPKAWKIALVAGAVGLAALVAVNLPTTTDSGTSQQATDAAPALQDSVAGFEYNNESTTGRVASPGVTAPYVGSSGELFPYENGAAPAQASAGSSASGPQAATDQALIDSAARDQAMIDLLAPVITQEFLDASTATAGTDPADRKFIDGQSATATPAEPHVPSAINGLR